MKLELTLHPIPGFPTPTGPHELAWSYILDAIFADAYHAAISHLHVSLPSERLSQAVTLRAELSARPDATGRKAVAILGQKRDLPAGYDRAYLLNFGAIAPRALQKLSIGLPGARLERTQSIFTLRARLWGIPIRLAGALNRPGLVDRAMFAMRRDFASSRDPSAYYQLSTWSQG